MGVDVSRGGFLEADSFELFRKAIHSSYDGYTSYKYVEFFDYWGMYTELVPEVVLTYAVDKNSAEETVFLAEKSTVDAWDPRKRVDVIFPTDTSAADVTNLEVAIQTILKDLDGYHVDTTGSEHYKQHSEAIQTILGSLDGYGQGGTDTSDIENAIQTILKDLDGYASDQTVTEHYQQHSEALTTILGALDGYGGGTFGTEYLYNSRDSEYSTTSSSWREVVSLSTGSLPAGDYHIGWSAELGCSNGNKIPYLQIEVDDTTVVFEHDTRFAHNSGYASHGGIVKITLGAGTHTVDLDINASDNGNYTTRIQRARIEMWRVS